MNNSNYTAIVQVKVSDEKLRKQLETVGEKTTLNIKVKASAGEIPQLKTEIKDLDKATESATSTSVKLDNATKSVSKSQRSLASDFATTTAKVLKFNLSTKAIQLFYTAIDEAKKAVFDFDFALTEFKKVSDLSGESLDSYTKKLGELGTEVARTRRMCA